MAYTVKTVDGDSWVRLINLQGKTPRVCQAFDTEWICDPCNPPQRRYQVRHAAGWRDHAWYEVITNDDTPRDQIAKYKFARQVIAAAQVLAAAEYAYRKLVA